MPFHIKVLVLPSKRSIKVLEFCRDCHAVKFILAYLIFKIFWGSMPQPSPEVLGPTAKIETAFN